MEIRKVLKDWGKPGKEMLHSHVFENVATDYINNNILAQYYKCTECGAEEKLVNVKERR